MLATRAAAPLPGRPIPDVARGKWAVILAGGDGVRLRPLTRRVSGDDRPKQFCSLLGPGTLWEQTARRALLTTSPACRVTVVTRTHEPYYAHLLGGERDRQVVVQPENRGTAPAILYACLRITVSAPTAKVVILPSDHWVSDDRTFMGQAEAALDALSAHPNTVGLLGMVPDRTECEYGWIEPGSPLVCDGTQAWGGSDLPRMRSPARLLRVRGFWEKPSADAAARLEASGCLWNTFVMAGQARAFLELIRLALPSLFEAFVPIRSALGRLAEGRVAREIYAGLPAVDFSRDVLAACPDRLAVLPVRGVSWSDLGSPERVRLAEDLAERRPPSGA